MGGNSPNSRSLDRKGIPLLCLLGFAAFQVRDGVLGGEGWGLGGDGGF